MGKHHTVAFQFQFSVFQKYDMSPFDCDIRSSSNFFHPNVVYGLIFTWRSRGYVELPSGHISVTCTLSVNTSISEPTHDAGSD